MAKNDDVFEAPLGGFRFGPVHPGRTLAAELQARGMAAHALARKLRVSANRITEIIAGSAQGDEFYDAKVKVLQEEIEHHVEEEEKRLEGLFAQARKAELDMDALGEQLAARKLELIEQFKASGIPTPQLKTMDEVSV